MKAYVLVANDISGRIKCGFDLLVRAAMMIEKD